MKEQLVQSRERAFEAKASLASSQNKGSVRDGLTRLRDTGRVSGFQVCIL